MKRYYILYKRICRIRWDSGAAVALYYVAMMWLIVLATVLFINYFHAYSSVGKSQMYADLVADGSVFNGNNGWGLDEDEADETVFDLIDYNEEAFEGSEISWDYVNIDADGKTSNNSANEENPNNTIIVDADTEVTFSTDDAITKTASASTRLTYSGGLKVVLEAYKHSYEYNPASQTWYVWGGGHGGDNSEWEQTADCSGFVSGVFRKCDYYIPSWACTWDMESMGTLVGTGQSALDKARPGDIILIWWSGSGSSDHVAIYAGKKNGTHYMIHARGGKANSGYNPGKGDGQGVHITKTPSSAARIMVRRIVDSTATVAETPYILVDGMSRNETIIYEGLKSAGYSNVSIAAIMGNWKWESGCNPLMIESYFANLSFCNDYATKIQNGQISKYDFVMHGVGRTLDGGSSANYSYGYGLAQWTTTNLTNPMADRKAKLWDYAEKCGSNVTNVYTQVAFAIQEFNTTHSMINYSFRNMTDVVSATTYFLQNFEGIMDDSLPNRIQYAQSYLHAFSSIS